MSARCVGRRVAQNLVGQDPPVAHVTSQARFSPQPEHSLSVACGAVEDDHPPRGEGAMRGWSACAIGQGSPCIDHRPPLLSRPGVRAGTPTPSTMVGAVTGVRLPPRRLRVFRGGSRMHIRPGRLRGTVVLLATIAIVFGVAAPAQAAPGQPGQPSGDTKLGAVRDVCATPTPNASKKPMKCLSLRRTDVAGGKGIKPNATPSGLGPAELRSAYSLPSDTAGANQTVAITIAYDNPNIEADLAVYRAQYGLPACTTANGCFRKVNQNGQASPLPAVNLDWGGESALDTQMVSAV